MCSKRGRAKPKVQGLAVPGVTKSGGAGASAGIAGVVLVTSHGFQGATISSRHGVVMTAIAGDGTGMERDYEFSSALHAADLDIAGTIGRRAGERAVKRLNPRKVATRRVPVVFDSRVANSLVGHLASSVNGAAITRKTSFLRDKLGERIFPAGIEIIDDPLRPRGLRSRPFDAEGVAGSRRHLVEDGVLKTWLLDCATARELELETTGHAQRSVSSTPSPGATNLHLAAGDKSADAADRRDRRRLLRDRHDRHGRQSGDRRLQPRRFRFLDRERRMHLSGQRDHDRRTPFRYVSRVLLRRTISSFVMAPTRQPCVSKV